MSSTNKTRNYGLNKWIGSDIPKMADFNQDNEVLDGVIGEHCSDRAVHISDEERARWNEFMDFHVYYGNGSSTQVVRLDIGFEPRMCIVIGNENLPGITDFGNEAHYNYFGIVTTAGGNAGLALNGKSLTVMQSTVALAGSEYRQYNQKGQGYIVIAIR